MVRSGPCAPVRRPPGSWAQAPAWRPWHQCPAAHPGRVRRAPLSSPDLWSRWGGVSLHHPRCGSAAPLCSLLLPGLGSGEPSHLPEHPGLSPDAASPVRCLSALGPPCVSLRWLPAPQGRGFSSHSVSWKGGWQRPLSSWAGVCSGRGHSLLRHAELDCAPWFLVLLQGAGWTGAHGPRSHCPRRGSSLSPASGNPVLESPHSRPAGLRCQALLEPLSLAPVFPAEVRAPASSRWLPGTCSRESAESTPSAQHGPAPAGSSRGRSLKFKRETSADSEPGWQREQVKWLLRQSPGWMGLALGEISKIQTPRSPGQGCGDKWVDVGGSPPAPH